MSQSADGYLGKISEDAETKKLNEIQPGEIKESQSEYLYEKIEASKRLTKRDYVTEQIENTVIGLLAEELVLKYERDKLGRV